MGVVRSFGRGWVVIKTCRGGPQMEGLDYDMSEPSWAKGATNIQGSRVLPSQVLPAIHKNETEINFPVFNNFILVNFSLLRQIIFLKGL